MRFRNCQRQSFHSASPVSEKNSRLNRVVNERFASDGFARRRRAGTRTDRAHPIRPVSSAKEFLETAKETTLRPGPPGSASEPEDFSSISFWRTSLGRCRFAPSDLHTDEYLTDRANAPNWRALNQPVSKCQQPIHHSGGIFVACVGQTRTNEKIPGGTWSCPTLISQVWAGRAALPSLPLRLTEL